MMKGYKYFTMKRISLFLLVLMLCCVFVGCNAEKFIINYDLDGGDCNGLVIEYLEGTEVKLPTPVKDGYIFIGWYDGDTKVEVITKGNYNLVAKWEKDNKIEYITISEAIEIANKTGETETVERYYIRGIIETVSNPAYGEMTIKDETGSLYVYGTYSADGSLRYSELEDKPVAGDEVVLYGPLKTYKGEAEMSKGWIIEFTHKTIDIDEKDYPSKTISETRSSEDGTKVSVEGVVAFITMANGYIPNGFFLVDDTASIYVYGEVSQTVNVGNRVKIAGEKIHYGASENSFGYPGALQLTNAVVLENDKGSHDFDKSWIKENTVKGILETDPSADITSTIYKVNALVVKAENPGFVNYYIDDLDGKTGSYVYTQCNGGDFSWLDEFDQKICTVYLTAINAKVTDAGCVYRFIPVAVSDDNYQMNDSDVSKFVLDYYVKDQFLTKYNSDPQLEVLTTASNEFLGFEGVAISYESSNSDVIKFSNVDDNLVMNALSNGSATIAVKAAYKTYEATLNIDIIVELVGEITSVTVKQCLDGEFDTEYTVKGVVAGSLVNQKGFYLVDETGVIAIRTTDTVLADLQVGNEVIMKGTKVIYESSKGVTQQICLLDAELVINYYGEHEYSKASFDTTKKLEDLIALSTEEYHTTQVYVVEAKVNFVESAYYSNCYLTTLDGTQQILLYTSNGNQYSWLKDFGDKVITVEICLCDWNNKSEYRGCLISATDGETTINNTLNFQK